MSRENYELIKFVHRVLSNFKHVIFTEKDVRDIVRKVRASGSENLKNYAYVTARNWAVDQMRESRREVLRAQNEAEDAKRKAEELAHKARFIEARAAFWPTTLRAIQSGKFRSDCQLELEFRIIWLGLFERKTEEELDKLFPELSRDARHQHRRRGRVRLMKFATGNLKKVLASNCKKNVPVPDF